MTTAGLVCGHTALFDTFRYCPSTGENGLQDAMLADVVGEFG
jgi:hypothetical protein